MRADLVGDHCSLSVNVGGNVAERFTIDFLSLMDSAQDKFSAMKFVYRFISGYAMLNDTGLNHELSAVAI